MNTKRQIKSPMERKRMITGIILMIPSLMAVIIFVFKPLLDSLFMSLMKIDLLFSLEEKFVGLDNYFWLFQTDWFLPDLSRTVQITVIVMGGQVIFALLIALLMDFDFPGKKVIRSLLITPWAIPVFVAALMWKWMYSANMSPFNGLLMNMGIVDESVSWLGKPDTAIYAVMLALIWHGLPFVFLTIYSGLQQVPEEVKEAAIIDGANGFQIATRITIPTIRPIISTVVILRTIFLFNQFPFIFLLTGGGPLNSTETLAIAAIRQGVSAFNYGRASTITTTLFIILVVLFLVYYNIVGKKEYD